MAMIELVDYNTVYGTDVAKTEKKSTRRRGGSTKAKTAEPAAKTVAPAEAEEKVADVTPVAEATPAAETEAPEAPAANEENAEKGE
jgi:large subunit ribosomal protein L17